ncbi:MAG TPA: YidC/Oxa1 family membrane protein insertase, partial [Chloroflexota bacterium]
MEPITEIWNAVLVDPIQAALLQLTTLTGSAGLAIIIFTVIVRTVLLPLSIQQVRSQRAMMGLQPRLRELQRRFAGDRQRIAQAQMQLYKE